jgi:hypothetical protein
MSYPGARTPRDIALTTHARAPAATPRFHPLPLDIAELEARLNDAGHTLMCLAVRGCRPAGERSFWPEIVQEVWEAYGYTDEDLPRPMPNARQVSRMDEALDWTRLIPLDPPRSSEAELHSRHGGAVLRRIVQLRMLIRPRTDDRHVYSFGKLADRFGASKEGVRRWHKQALERILRELHRAPDVPRGRAGGISPSPSAQPRSLGVPRTPSPSGCPAPVMGAIQGGFTGNPIGRRLTD